MLGQAKQAQESACSTGEHAHSAQARIILPVSEVEQASRIFRALGEPARLRLVARLAEAPACVSELAAAEAEAIPLISQRLRVLRSDNIVRRRRDGKHMLYFLADQHVRELVQNALAHAAEGGSRQPLTHSPEKEISMANTHEVHENHPHQHGADCGHTAIQHDDHVDYLHDGHLHNVHEGHVDEHVLEVNAKNPDDCTNGHDCSGHEADHKHGEDCGHEAVPHGGHVDYLVDGHLHNQDGDHCDNHGAVQVVS